MQRQARFAGALAAILALGIASGCTRQEARPPAAPAPAAAGQPAAPAGEVTIEYWQYSFETKVKLMDKLIQEFQARNPGIRVVQTNFPYEQYNEKVATAVPAGRGPDVINLYYGWLPLYTRAGYLQPLPEQHFPPAAIEKEFVPMVQAARVDGQYWALPTGVRTLALLWNKDLFRAAGLDPERPPATWDELQQYAVKLTRRAPDGKLEQAGLAFQPTGQGHNWFREALVRQSGGVPLSPDRRKVQWTSPAGLAAWRWYMELATKYKVGEPGFQTDDITAFRTGKAAMNIDGSFRVAALKAVPNLNWASATLPVGPQQIQATMGSFWANGITRNATGPKLEAAIKFLTFLTSPGVMQQWVKEVGELPARAGAVPADLVKDPHFRGFVEGLGHAHATWFVDESKDRAALVDAADAVLAGKAAPDQALREAEAKVQKLYDDYWAQKK